MDRLPSPIKAAESENMAFNTQSSQDIDDRFNLLQSGLASSPILSEHEESLGEFPTDRD